MGDHNGVRGSRQTMVAQRDAANEGASTSTLLLSMTDFTDVKQIGKGK